MTTTDPARINAQKLPFLAVAALLTLSVIMQALAFHPVVAWPLAWIALVPWMIALVGMRTHKALFWSMAVGFGFFFFGVFWLAEVHWGALVCAAVGEGAIYAIFGAALCLVVRKLRLPMTLALPVLWVGMEFLRNFALTGFPWLFLGHTQFSLLWLIQISDITGAYGVSFVIAAANGLVADVILYKMRRSPANLSTQKLCAAGAGVLCLLAGVCVYGAIRIKGVREEMRPGPQVLLVQPNLEQSIKSNRDMKQTPFLTCLELSASISAKKLPDMIVWPETMLPPRWYVDPDNPQRGEEFVEDITKGPLRANDPQNRPMQATRQQILEYLIQQTGCPLFAGGVHVNHTPCEISWWNPNTGEFSPIELPYTEKRNSIYFIDKNGQQTGRYDKTHLVPYGEYIALQDIFPFLPDAIHEIAGFVRELEPGDPDQQIIFKVTLRDGSETFTFCAPICYEIIFGDQVAGMVSDGEEKKAQFIVNASNDGWFRESAELEQTTVIAAFRAVENRVGVIRATNTGISGFIKPDGSFSWHRDFLHDGDKYIMGRNKSIRDTIQRKVFVSDIHTFYSRFKDMFALAISAIAGVLVIFGVVLGIAAKRRAKKASA